MQNRTVGHFKSNWWRDIKIYKDSYLSSSGDITTLSIYWWMAECPRWPGAEGARTAGLKAEMELWRQMDLLSALLFISSSRTALGPLPYISIDPPVLSAAYHQYIATARPAVMLAGSTELHPSWIFRGTSLPWIVLWNPGQILENWLSVLPPLIKNFQTVTAD